MIPSTFYAGSDNGTYHRSGMRYPELFTELADYVLLTSMCQHIMVMANEQRGDPTGLWNNHWMPGVKRNSCMCDPPTNTQNALMQNWTQRFQGARVTDMSSCLNSRYLLFVCGSLDELDNCQCCLLQIMQAYLFQLPGRSSSTLGLDVSTELHQNGKSSLQCSACRVSL